MKFFKVLGIILLVLLIIIGGLYAALKIPKSTGVTWTAEDYASYQKKVNARSEATGDFNLTNVALGKFQSSGKMEVERTFTSAEISSALSTENNINGPIKDIKVKFLGNNEGIATFKLTKEMDKYVKRTDETLARYPFIAKSLENTPVYMKVKVDPASPNTITADISSLYVGQFPLPERAVNTVESVAVQQVNNMLANYKNLKIDEMRIEADKLYFKGELPAKLDAVK